MTRPTPLPDDAAARTALVPTAPRTIGRAVVTGGAGFLGSHLCTALVERGVEVVCLDSFLTGSPANVAHLMGDPLFHLVRCDVTEFIHAAGPVDLVLHFASPASPVDYLQLPIQTLKVGAIGAHHALGLAKDKGARFVLTSTSEVYGDPQVHPQREDYFPPARPRSGGRRPGPPAGARAARGSPGPAARRRRRAPC